MKKIKFGNVASFIGGGTPDRNRADFWGGDIPWASVKDLKDKWLMETSEYITESGVKNSATRVIAKHSLIIATRMALGRVAITQNDIAINQDLKALKLDDDVDMLYCYNFLTAKQPEIENLGNGATVKGVSLDALRQLEISIPPLAEQRRIAAILDKADAICRKRQEALKLADAFVKSVFLDMFGDPVLNPKGWKYSTFKECSVRLSDGPFGSNLKSEHYVSAGIRVVRLQNIGSGNFIDKDKAYISQNHYQKLSKYTCRPGDILVGTLGEPNLRACIVPSDIEISINKADCVHYIPKKDTLVGEFVCQYINMPAMLAFAVDKFHGQTRTRISSGQFACLPLPLPPLPLQNRFAEIVQRVEAHKQRLKAHLSEAEQMKKALQQQFFG